MGDEIIVTGQARLMQQKNPAKIIVLDRLRRPRMHEMWNYNPRISAGIHVDRDAMQELQNCPGIRPYIRAKTERQWTWNDWECPIGEIYFGSREREFAERAGPIGVILEPSIKAKASPNKDWGRHRWQALAEILLKEGLDVVQIGPAGTALLTGVRFVETPTFRLACVVLNKAQGAILPEGGLHHAAAAMGVKSVVIFGGFISPRQTGYSNQRNLFTGGEPCGMRIPCDHCDRAMELISPELAFSAFRSELVPDLVQ